MSPSLLRLARGDDDTEEDAHAGDRWLATHARPAKSDVVMMRALSAPPTLLPPPVSETGEHNNNNDHDNDEIVVHLEAMLAAREAKLWQEQAVGDQASFEAIEDCDVLEIEPATHVGMRNAKTEPELTPPRPTPRTPQLDEDVDVDLLKPEAVYAFEPAAPMAAATDALLKPLSYSMYPPPRMTMRDEATVESPSSSSLENRFVVMPMREVRHSFHDKRELAMAPVAAAATTATPRSTVTLLFITAVVALIAFALLGLAISRSYRMCRVSESSQSASSMSTRRS